MLPTKFVRLKKWSRLQGITGARYHHRDRSRHASPLAPGNSGQEFHSRPDGTLRLRRMPVHENEYLGESFNALRDLEPEIILPEPLRVPRGIANPANARTQPLSWPFPEIEFRLPRLCARHAPRKADTSYASQS
jgi:hypothetical protein